jgi:inorganic pyrophosphatase
MPEELLQRIAHFFEHYKDLEEGKWVRVGGWEGAEAAKQEILASIACTTPRPRNRTSETETGDE